MKNDLSTVLHYGGGMIGLSIIAIVFSLSNLYCASKTAVGFSTQLRKRMFRTIQQFSFNNIDKFSQVATKQSIDKSVELYNETFGIANE